jgi:hypothetical protein
LQGKVVVIPDQTTKGYGWISTVNQIIRNLGSRQLHAEAVLPPEKGTWYPLDGRHGGRNFQMNAVENREKIYGICLEWNLDC